MDANGDAQAAARELARRAQEVRFTPLRRAWRKSLRWLTDGEFGRTGPWNDRRCDAYERVGWRVREAALDDDEAFAVTYWVCRKCHSGWVEWPYTAPQYLRCGLASAGLAALRTDNPRTAWYTLGGHDRDAIPFWKSVGAGVPGGYAPRDPCEHNPQRRGRSST